MLKEIQEYAVVDQPCDLPLLVTNEDGAWSGVILTKGNVKEAVQSLAVALGKRLTPAVKEWFVRESESILDNENILTTVGLPKKYRYAMAWALEWKDGTKEVWINLYDWED